MEEVKTGNTSNDGTIQGEPLTAEELQLIENALAASGEDGSQYTLKNHFEAQALHDAQTTTTYVNPVTRYNDTNENHTLDDDLYYAQRRAYTLTNGDLVDKEPIYTITKNTKNENANRESPIKFKDNRVKFYNIDKKINNKDSVNKANNENSEGKDKEEYEDLLEGIPRVPNVSSPDFDSPPYFDSPRSLSPDDHYRSINDVYSRRPTNPFDKVNSNYDYDQVKYNEALRRTNQERIERERLIKQKYNQNPKQKYNQPDTYSGILNEINNGGYSNTFKPLEKHFTSYPLIDIGHRSKCGRRPTIFHLTNGNILSINGMIEFSVKELLFDDRKEEEAASDSDITFHIDFLQRDSLDDNLDRDHINIHHIDHRFIENPFAMHLTCDNIVYNCACRIICSEYNVYGLVIYRTSFTNLFKQILETQSVDLFHKKIGNKLLSEEDLNSEYITIRDLYQMFALKQIHIHFTGEILLSK